MKLPAWLRRKAPEKQPAPPAVELTNEAFARWLRAFRPDLAWFLGLPADEQEQLAILGDEHRKDTCVAIGWAVRDPAAAAAGVAAARGSEDAEVELVQRIAGKALAKILHRDEPSAPAAPRKPAPMTMRGTGRKVGP